MVHPIDERIYLALVRLRPKPGPPASVWAKLRLVVQLALSGSGDADSVHRTARIHRLEKKTSTEHPQPSRLAAMLSGARLVARKARSAARRG